MTGVQTCALPIFGDVGHLVDGNPDKVTDVTDVWTFARDTTSRDPNWKLVATEAGQ